MFAYIRLFRDPRSDSELESGSVPVKQWDYESRIQTHSSCAIITSADAVMSSNLDAPDRVSMTL
jgi:hypothetical protein